MIGGGSDAGGKHWDGVRFVEHFAGKLRPRELVLATVDVLPAARDWAQVLAGAWLSRWTVDPRNASAPAVPARGWTTAMAEHNHSGCLDATHAPGCDQVRPQRCAVRATRCALRAACAHRCAAAALVITARSPSRPCLAALRCFAWRGVQDGRFSLVQSRGRWLLFGRANALVHGGRTVQVRRTDGAKGGGR